ncbi:MAG: tRNA 2-thiouridine(34) synthase MnmA [Planctomycetota bacterium]
MASGRKPTREKVLVAMSGGVDSSVAAALLLEQGYDVVGVFMRLGSPGETLDELQPFDSAGVSCDPTKVKIGHQGCCSINDAADARLVAAELGVPFYVCNFKKDFGRIIDYFVDEYADGRTPNPCVRCNDWLKFGKLHDYAGQIGATMVASGHYARIDREHPSGPRLLRGADEAKDQSYVLFGAPQARLNDMMLPIGVYETKAEVRALAERFSLPTFDKPDSQEICFVPDNDYAGLVERRRPELAEAGAILDPSGNVVGEHSGQHHFTIGQRRGVGVALGYPIYVVDRDPVANTVTVGPKDMLLTRSCRVREANWLADAARFGDWQPVLAQVRYNSRAVPAQARRLADAESADDTPSGRPGRFEVRFADPQRAVAPGQALVLFDADEPAWVLGGGWIADVERAGAADTEGSQPR